MGQQPPQPRRRSPPSAIADGIPTRLRRGQTRGLASIALFGAAEGFALAGGAFSAWLHFLAVPVLRKRRLNATQSRIRDLQKFIDRLDNDDDSGRPLP